MTILAVWFWLIVTGAHFLLTSRFARRALPADASFDEIAFAVVLGGIGTLSFVLHVVATTTGLTLAAGLVALGISHGLLWALTPAAQVQAAPQPRPTGVVRAAEALAATVIAGVLLTWVDVASQSSAVSGTDAAHYHVPVALNLALGAKLFDLPATPHLYPMAGSLLDAWFLVPVGGPLIVDLAMCLPFLLLTVSMNWIFRLTTGQSGLAWSSWVVLLLFATPLFRSSSLVSADLWFASAFVALSAAIVSAWARRRWRPGDVALASLALGLLLGSKTTGAAAAALVVAACVLAELGRLALGGRDRRSLWPSRWWLTLLAAFTLILGAGGIWLLRNWVRFGSPIAPTGLTVFGLTVFEGDPFQPTSYLSVLGDLQKDASYDLVSRTVRFIRLWLGGWFVPALALMALVPIDLAIARPRQQWPDARAARALVLAIGVGAGGLLVWLLVGAPWTSLEWTRGFSLRYALPIAALLPLVAFIGLFPLSLRWYERPSIAPAAIAALAAGSILTFYLALDPRLARYVEVPPIAIGWLVAGAALVGVVRWASHRRFEPIVAVLLLLVFASVWAPVMSARAARNTEHATAQEAQERADFARAVPPGNVARLAYLTALATEDRKGLSCRRRRFFALSRFDEPLMLQSAAYANLVFYAGRDVDWTRSAAPLGPCDYIVSTPAVVGTQKGGSLIVALASGAPVDQIGSAGPFVIIGRR